MHRRWFKLAAFVLAVVLLACTSGVIWAEDGHKTGEKPGVLSPRLDLGVWTIVVFVLLLLVLRKYAWGPILEGLQTRESNIREALAQAQRARDEAQHLRAELQKEMSSAADKVRQIMDEARRDAQRAKDEMIVHARAEIQGERERLQREIAMARDQALQELWSQTAQLATLISSRAIRRQLTVDDHRRLVDDAIAELRNVEANGGVRLSM